jgi:histone arginine demethylase JMJD6
MKSQVCHFSEKFRL